MFIYYVINVYVPRVRANAYHVLTTPPRVFRDPKMCLRNIWTAPNSWSWCVVDINTLVRAADRGAHDYQEF